MLSKEYNPLRTLALMLAALTFATMMGGSMVMNGLITGVMTFVALYVIVSAVAPVQMFMKKYPLLTDLTVTLGIFAMNKDKGPTALLAAATVGVLFTIFIRIGMLGGINVKGKMGEGWRAFMEGVNEGIAEEKYRDRLAKGIPCKTPKHLLEDPNFIEGEFKVVSRK